MKWQLFDGKDPQSIPVEGDLCVRAYRTPNSRWVQQGIEWEIEVLRYWHIAADYWEGEYWTPWNPPDD